MYGGSCPRDVLHFSEDCLANSCFSVTTAHFCVFFPFPHDSWDVFWQTLSCICWCEAAGGEAEWSLPLLGLLDGSGKLPGGVVARPSWSPMSCRWDSTVCHKPSAICHFGVTAPKPLIFPSLGCSPPRMCCQIPAQNSLLGATAPQGAASSVAALSIARYLSLAGALCCRFSSGCSWCPCPTAAPCPFPAISLHLCSE